jgi:hypothetical protein
MSHRDVLAMFVLTECGTWAATPVATAQLPRHVERCLPYPTYAQEVDTMFSKPRNPLEADPAPEKAFVIDSIEFDEPITLPEPARQRLVHELKGKEFDDLLSQPGLDEIAEGSIRGTWQDEGYFKVSDSVAAKVLAGDGHRTHVALRVHVDEGRRYRMGKIQFRSADPDAGLAFTTGTLQSLFPLKEGDVFDADKIRRSLDAYRKLYASDGYIDFSSTPDFDVDDAQKQVSLTLEFDQQKQFHVDEVLVDSLDAKAERVLRSMIKPGDVYDDEVLKRFFDENRPALPPFASEEENLTIRKNVKAATVSLHFDFFACSEPAQ